MLKTFNQVKGVQNSSSHFDFFSILLLVCNEDVYINNIIALLIANKNTNKFTWDIVGISEGRSRDARERFEKKGTVPNQSDYDQTFIGFREANLLVSQIQFTNCYCKIITSSSVKPIFSQAYNRMARVIKDKAVDNEDDETEEEGIFYIGL